MKKRRPVHGFWSNIERTLRALGQATFQRLYRHRRTEPLELGTIERILLVRTDKIGDAIVSTPVIQGLRKKFPNATIDMLLGNRNSAVAPLLPFLDGLLVVSRSIKERLRMLTRLRANRYDVAIDMLYSDSITAAIFTGLSGARIKIGFEDSASPFYDFVIPRPTHPMHHVPKLLLLAAPLEITVDSGEARTAVKLSPESLEFARASLSKLRSDGPFLMINISGSSRRKFWGIEHYAALARQLGSDGFGVLVLSAPADETSLREIVQQSGASMIAPRPDLMEFAAILSFADMVVSPDTSIVHIAAALGKPVVALVDNPLTAVEWAPWGVPHRVVGCPGEIPDIPDGDVLSAVRDLTREIGLHGRALAPPQAGA